MRAESLLVEHHSRHAQPEQASGSAATAAASARLTRRRGAYGRVGWERPVVLSWQMGKRRRREYGSLDRLSRYCAASRSSDRPLPRQPIEDNIRAATDRAKGKRLKCRVAIANAVQE